jgi:hypothetical protein
MLSDTCIPSLIWLRNCKLTIPSRGARRAGNRTRDALRVSAAYPDLVILPAISQPKEGIIMASPALQQTDFQAFEPSITTDFRSLSDLTASLEEAPFLTRESDHLSISTSDGLKGARAALVAIALEGSAVLFLYGIWYAWHSLR